MEDRLPEGVKTVMVVFETGGWTRDDKKVFTHITMAEYFPPMTCKVSDYWPECEETSLMDGDGDFEDRFIKSGFYETMFNCEECYWIGERVTHWMPVPPLPEKQQNAGKDNE